MGVFKCSSLQQNVVLSKEWHILELSHSQESKQKYIYWFFSSRILINRHDDSVNEFNNFDIAMDQNLFLSLLLIQANELDAVHYLICEQLKLSPADKSDVFLPPVFPFIFHKCLNFKIYSHYYSHILDITRIILTVNKSRS